MTSLWTGWALALLLGIRHASEPDHLVAVSTLLTERRGRPGRAGRPSRASGIWLGAIWGVGHSLSLLAVGALLLLARLNMPERVAVLAELVVSLMLMFLGVRALMRAFQAGKSDVTAAHAHGADAPHVHPGTNDHVHLGAWTLARRPLVIGLIHGMAGSGALTALTLANMPSVSAGLVYMALFGVGSIAGMAIVTGALGWPLSHFSHRVRTRVAVNFIAGATSLVFGVMWGAPLVQKLLQG